MNCWHCKTELIWGGDEDLEDDDDHCMVKFQRKTAGMFE